MVKDDKIFLLHFTLRTGMYISKIDEFNIQSFLGGYEIGKGGDYDFTGQLSDYLADKHKIRAGSTRLYGQLIDYAEKKSISWHTAFRQTSLEVLAADKNGGFDEEMKKLLKGSVSILIDRINENGHPWFNTKWIEDYMALVRIQSVWFKEMWSKGEYDILKSIHKLINKGMIFDPEASATPTQVLLELKHKFNALQR